MVKFVSEFPSFSKQITSTTLAMLRTFKEFIEKTSEVLESDYVERLKVKGALKVLTDVIDTSSKFMAELALHTPKLTSESVKPAKVSFMSRCAIESILIIAEKLKELPYDFLEEMMKENLAKALGVAIPLYCFLTENYELLRNNPESLSALRKMVENFGLTEEDVEKLNKLLKWVPLSYVKYFFEKVPKKKTGTTETESA